MRVDHGRYADSRWYTGSGIYRDVWLVSAPETHFHSGESAGMPNPSRKTGYSISGHGDTEAYGRTIKLEVKASLYDAGNNLVASRTIAVNDREAGLSKVATELRIKNPHLWNLDEPYLYTLETDILSDGQKIDGSKTRVGLRTLTFDADKGFALNGNWMKSKESVSIMMPEFSVLLYHRKFGDGVWRISRLSAPMQSA